MRLPIIRLGAHRDRGARPRGVDVVQDVAVTHSNLSSALNAVCVKFELDDSTYELHGAVMTAMNDANINQWLGGGKACDPPERQVER